MINMIKYEAILISPNGDWITDFEEYRIEEVKEDLAIANSTRKNFLESYPYQFIIKAPKRHLSTDVLKEKVIDVVSPKIIKFMKRWTIDRAIKTIVVVEKIENKSNVKEEMNT